MVSRIALVNTVLLVLVLVFAGKVIESLLYFLDGKVARSSRDMFDEYVTFPSISICMGEGDPSSKGFEDFGTRPMNTTLDEFEFVRHFKNG